MQRLQFIIAYSFLWLFSKLPFFVLHRISDFAFLILYYLFNYRKEVVLDNLKIAFPEKTHKELLSIRRKFFRHFTDIFIETAKSFTISNKELAKRYKFVNPEIFETVEKSGKSVALMGAHYANWEWIVSVPRITNLECIGIYQSLSNPYFDNLIQKNRSRFGGTVIPMNQTAKRMVRNKIDGIPSLYGLLSDQSPTLHRTQYWNTFLNARVPIHTGAESLAKKHDFTVMYFKVDRVKRGYYEVHLDILTDTPKEIPNFQITDEFLKRTEKQIQEKPEFYFWTHKRFKHKDQGPA